jgi:fumarate hydratase class II
MSADRIERDSLGEVRVPDDVYYGAHTARARDNFPVSGRGLRPGLIHALGLLKGAAARANASLGLLPPPLADAIARAADEVVDGRLDDHFVVDVFQTGSGTSSNMNANEVIARRANEVLTGGRSAKDPVHPNDHVNLGQSSNDVFPTAIHVAALLAIDRQLVPALTELRDALTAKAHEFDDVVKIGRTHLQDATPVRLGQEFAGYARMMQHGLDRLREARAALEEVALGGTAVGTGINTHPEFAARALVEVNARTGLALRPAEDYFEALGSRHAVVAASGALKTLATDLMKVGNDLRLLASGPHCGLAEITLPALQPGSSIMPGKVNPVVPEAVCQVAAQVIGNDMAITVGGQSGLLELNVMMPMMADNLLESIELLANVSLLLARRCVTGIVANRERCGQLIEGSLALTTALAPRLGYDEAARLAKIAHEQGRTIRDAARQEAGLPPDELERLLDPKRMTGGDTGTAAPG